VFSLKGNVIMTRVEEAIEINVPVHTAYDQWTRVSQFPQFMEGIKEVRQIDDAHLHWVAESDGRQMEWDTEVTQQVPDEIVAWRTTSGAASEGAIRFEPLGEDRTRIKCEMSCDSPTGGNGKPADAATLAQKLRGDMLRFKTMIESQGREIGVASGAAQAGASTSGATTQGAASTGNLQQQQQTEGQSQRSLSSSQGSGWLPHLTSMWEEPFAMMRRMSEEMDRMVERFIGRAPGFTSSPLPQWTPAVEVSQVGDQLVVSADLPGLSREDVNIEVRGDKLILEGQRQEPPPSGDPAIRRSERRFGRFYRMITLPHGTDADAATATMQDGVLQIRMPLADIQSRGRIIEIQDTSAEPQAHLQAQPEAGKETQEEGQEAAAMPLPGSPATTSAPIQTPPSSLH
jgi:HSP20 family molecular chaperone IbpA/uncharacterized membrane protein